MTDQKTICASRTQHFEPMPQLSAATKPLISRKSDALQGSVSVPGDKSISHRALILGALAQGRTEIAGLLESEDILCTARALQELGTTVHKSGHIWTVTGSGLGGLTQPESALDFGNSGTGARLMMGVVAGHPIRAVFTGDESLKRRPMGRVLDPLKRMGLQVSEGARLTLPLTLSGCSGLVPIEYRLPVPSAQVKSAILLAGLLAPGRTSVIEAEKTRDHTEKMLTYFGATVSSAPDAGGMRISVEGLKDLEGKPVAVPGDPSSAAFLTAAAILCPGSSVLIRNVLVNPTRTGLYETLAEMGADIVFENKREQNGEPVADLRAKASSLHGVHVPAARAPAMIDEYPILAVLAAFAGGTTIMEGLAELRVKESDRLAVMVAGLTACGVLAEARGDTLAVTGSAKVRGGATISTHMDHRIAMAFLVLGLAALEPVKVDDASMIATSFPEFRGLMQGLGASFEDVAEAGAEPGAGGS
jgi:3-phosphoshikimate 1-carboxyvinyltransferase